MKGAGSRGIAKAVLEIWEANSTPVVAHVLGKLRGEPELHTFRMIGKEDRIDSFEEVVDACHVELLRSTDGIDVS